MQEIGHGGHGPEVQRLAVHDHRVQFDVAACVEKGTPSGIEGGVGLQDVDRPFHRVEGREALFQQGIDGVNRLTHARHVSVHEFVRNIPGPTMHNEFRLHIYTRVIGGLVCNVWSVPDSGVGV